MGFGLPSAVGAKVAAPEKIVVDIDGDASFSMTAMELATASQYGIGVKVLVLNNEFQGMVLQWQGASPAFMVRSGTSSSAQICSTTHDIHTHL
jgi:thiamine pyrophosphate-dependent acetolactate synthase large subunit-like protein